MRIANFDGGNGSDNFNIMPQVCLHEHNNSWIGKFLIDKFEFPEEIREEAERFSQMGATIQQLTDKYGKDIYLDHVDVGNNLLLNEGINEMLLIITGNGSPTIYNNANARLGVGASTTAAAATDTALLTTPTFKAMDATFPSVSAQTMTFRSTFVSADANINWNEFSVDNGATPNKNLNRLVSAQGTKASGQTWQLTLNVTLA